MDMLEEKKIKNALVSVFHKDGLDVIVQRLNELGVRIYSTGGTQKYIEELGIKVNKVEELTSYPSILGGRVKTLHPKVFGGILARRQEENDQSQLAEYEIPEIDLVIVDLYPFEKTIASTDNESAIIEKIDIGGISLIRAAAKNYKDVLIIAEMNQYNKLSEILAEGDITTLAQRKSFATTAFKIAQKHYASVFSLVYLQVLWSSLVGIFIFNEYMNLYAYIGAIFIVLSGIVSLPSQIKQLKEAN